MTQPAVRRFTGHHAAAIIVAFFAVVIAVNVFMARMAISTFGGVVVENSYVASQHYNKWLDEAAREKALGWTARTERGAGDMVELDLADAAGQPLVGAKLVATAVHPLGRVPDRSLAVREAAPGRYVTTIEPGRWRLRLSVTAQGHTWRTVGDLK